jgi:signal transduction histidine kinase
MTYPPITIRTRIIILYMTLIAAVYLGFSIYIYCNLWSYLEMSQKKGCLRRANQVLAALEQLPAGQRSTSGITDLINARYAPELNERIIRVTNSSGHLIYKSKNGDLLQATPFAEPLGPIATKEPQVFYRKDHLDTTPHFQVVGVVQLLDDGTPFAVEVAAPTTDIDVALSNLATVLATAFPMLALIAVSSGYVLLGRALHPIDQVISTAEIISIKNLSQRLPVAPTGDEFERMSLSLNRMIERLQESYLVSSRFAADASHQLRTPLTIMRGELEGLIKLEGMISEGHSREELLGGEELVDSLGSILEESERLTRIVEGLLLLSRLEVGEGRMAGSILNLGDLVDSIVEQTALLAEYKSIAIKRVLEPEVWLEADELRVRQAVINLLDNAIKYTPEGGIITIRVARDEELASVEVADTGIGIPPESLPFVFHRFYRSETVKTQQIPGSGLGLCIVETIAQAHQGTVTVSSELGKGSTFRLQLPLTLSIKR